VTETLTVALPLEAISPAAFDELYRSSASDVYAYVASLVRDQAVAEEVTAVAFERAFRRRRLYRPRRGSPRQWLFGIARNAALDELRRARRQSPPLPDSADGGEEVEHAVERSLRRNAVATAIRSLEPADRELVALKFFAGLSNREIGRVLHISESNAGTRVHRVLVHLREQCRVTP
jgi:RNA polymerase sigma factor (sigma-70 family)